MRVRGGWKGQAALVLGALTDWRLGLWKLFWCWHKVLRKEGRWNKWHNILTTLWVWTMRRSGVMRIWTQIRPTLIYLESDNLNPNLAPSSELMVSPERSGSGIIFLLRSAKEMRLLWGKQGRRREVSRYPQPSSWPLHLPPPSVTELITTLPRLPPPPLCPYL